MRGRDTHFTGAPELGYQAERGIGQGESASSLMWTALYDILLEWIDLTNNQLHEAEKRLDYSDEDAAGACPSAYADDLCTITSGPRAAANSSHMDLSILCVHRHGHVSSQDILHNTRTDPLQVYDTNQSGLTTQRRNHKVSNCDLTGL